MRKVASVSSIANEREAKPGAGPFALTALQRENASTTNPCSYERARHTSSGRRSEPLRFPSRSPLAVRPITWRPIEMMTSNGSPRWLFAAGFALTLAGCGGKSGTAPADGGGDGRGGVGGSAGGSGGGGGHVAGGSGGTFGSVDALGPLVDAYCAAVQGCCQRDGFPAGPLADCKATFAGRDATLVDHVSRGTIRLDATVFQACVAAYQGAVSSCSLTEVAHACRDMFVGTRAENEPCADGSECKSDQGAVTCLKVAPEGSPQPDTGLCKKVPRGKKGDRCVWECHLGPAPVPPTRPAWWRTRC